MLTMGVTSVDYAWDMSPALFSAVIAIGGIGGSQTGAVKQTGQTQKKVTNFAEIFPNKRRLSFAVTWRYYYLIAS